MQVNLSIKGVPDALAQKLRERAARNHRSLQGELMAIIEEAATTAQSAPPVVAEPSERLRIEDIAARHRARFAEPLSGFGRATDMIRDDRDTR